MKKENILSIICLLLFSVSLFLGGIQTLAPTRLFNENFHYGIQDKLLYYPRLTRLINEDVATLMKTYDVPSSSITDVMRSVDTYYYVKTKTKETLNAKQTGQPLKPIKDELEVFVMKDVHEYLSRIKRLETDFSKDELQQLKREMVHQIMKHLTPVSEEATITSGIHFVNFCFNVVANMMKPLTLVGITAIVIMGLLIINIKKKIVVFYYLAIGCFLTSVYCYGLYFYIVFCYEMEILHELTLHEELFAATLHELHQGISFLGSCLLLFGILLLMFSRGYKEWEHLKIEFQ